MQGWLWQSVQGFAKSIESVNLGIHQKAVMNMYQKVLAIALMHFAIESLHSQVTSERSMTKGGFISEVSDPNSKAMLARYALNPSVAKELKLSDDQVNALRSLLERAKGHLRTCQLDPCRVNHQNKLLRG